MGPIESRRKLERGCRTVRILIRAPHMRLWMGVAALLSFPIAAWHSFQARRRLRGYLLPSGNGRFTVERVA